MRGFINLIFLWVLAALIATHFVFFGHILLFAAAATPATGTSKVVFVGDSWAEFAEKVALPKSPGGFKTPPRHAAACPL